MGRQEHSDSYPQYSKSLFHIIKHHPLCHHFIQKKHAYNCGDGKTSVTGTVLAQRDEAFSCDKRKNLSLAKLSNLNVEENVTPHSLVGKGRSQRDDATSSSDCNLNCKHHQSVKNDLLALQVTDKKKHRVESNARKHIFGVSTRLCKHFIGGLEITNMNKKILLTFRHDPVFPLVYHFHKQQHLQRAKMTLNRSESFPFPYSFSKRKGRLYSDNETKKSVLFVSSKTACEQVMPSVAKAKVNGNFNMNEAVIIVRDVKFSSVSAKGQNSLKQKIEHVTGESGKEKIRVAMDSVIHKLPQGQRISDRLKNEILKKLTEPIIKREVQYKSSIRRTVSLQEPLESYCKTLENSFKTRTSQSEKLNLGIQKEHSPLRMLIPLQRILSLPDLQSFSYASQKGDFSDFTPENLAIIDKKDLVISNIVKSSGSISKSGSTDKSTNVFQNMEIQTKKLKYEIPQIHVNTKLKEEFEYVKYVLEISGFTSYESISSAWHSRDTPVDPSLYEEMENDPEFCGKIGGECNHHVLFDLINETMLEIYGKSYGYLPSIVGCHILHKVWTHMSKSLSLRFKVGQKIDDHVSRDLAKNDGWVNIQFYDEYFGLVVEDMVFHDLVKEIVLDLGCL